ncbi:sensor protein DegS [Peptoclostridium acidaminophilum DSM 3953]|uniref:histidine kinase n=1 Tax=Peptoclostridium acidaminophilum DSM 3953 TaxID=1286171 RepID=W8U5T0_PEPAC|nr:sensor histidine kinase [Peptoclostridium acidaminophilum]AHM56286.1 sensor protein DegS [Peptoclostridium acidaminophilum DSM 3953]
MPTDEIKSFDFDIKNVLDGVVQSIQNGQDEIFEISENIRRDCEDSKVQLEKLKKDISRVITEVELLTIEEKKSRRKLLDVSRRFGANSEEQIKRAYEEANECQIRLSIKAEEEKNLIKTRNELEIRMKKNSQMLEKAESYMSKMASVTDFLVADLSGVKDTIELLEDKNSINVRIIRAQEEERSRIARDIHDGPAQSVASLIVKSEIILKLLDRDRELVKKEIESMKGQLRDTLREIRRVMYDLRPASLDELGLLPTIKRLISDLENERGVDIELIALGEKQITSPIVRLTVYRVIQESLINACKYSGGGRIVVRIDIQDNYISGIIQDFGIGFDPQKQSGFGIGSMKERMQLIGGKIGIESVAGKGTRVDFFSFE